MRFRNVILAIMFLCFLTSVNAEWFDKDYSKDVIYSKIDALTGSIETTTTFMINVTAPVYAKVLGTYGISPWLTEDSDWYIDMYIRPDLSSDWINVASYVKRTYPSKEVTVKADTMAEFKAIIYHPTKIETTLAEDVFPEATAIKCVNTKNFPESGVIQIEDEYIKYNSKNITGALLELTHGYMGSIATHHPAGTKVKLFSGTYHIPFVIAINISEKMGGGGGAMHPSRGYVIDFKIAEGMPPVAVFSCQKWYNKVFVNASKSYDPDGKIVSYQWDWESDGNYDDGGVYAEHTYNKEGYYLITLKVTDDDGMSSTYSYAVNVIMPPRNANLLTILSKRIVGLPVWAWIAIVLFIIFVIKKSV